MNASKVCSKTPILETWQIQSEHLVECSAYLVILLLYPFHCHASNRRQCHTDVMSLVSGLESGRITCVEVLG